MTYIVPTMSLMLGPEAEFDEYNPADYALFGIRYLLLPTGMSPPVPAQSIMVDGPFSLWHLEGNAYVHLVEVTNSVTANRSDIGTESVVLLDTVGPGRDWAVNWPGMPSPPLPATPAGQPGGQVGTVDSVSQDLGQGAISTDVNLTKPGVVLFSVAYDPGWHASVDGREVATEMLAPALVGVPVPAGFHQVVLRYRGFGWYPELWVGGVLVLLALAAMGRRGHRRPGVPDEGQRPLRSPLLQGN
jgi:hypothetical protein